MLADMMELFFVSVFNCEQHVWTGFDEFLESAKTANFIPIYERIYSDQLTPVGRFSFIGAQPVVEIVASDDQVTVLDNVKGTRDVTTQDDPLQVCVDYSDSFKAATAAGLPDAFCGAAIHSQFFPCDQVGGSDTPAMTLFGENPMTRISYSTYVYKSKLPVENAPEDDRSLPDIHLALYKDVVVFDNSTK
eukprot:gene23725-28755_t